MNEFIELHREFYQIPDKYTQKATNDGIDLMGSMENSYEASSWSELLKEYRTIILAEAGSGKTQEIRYKAQQAKVDGKASFFLRLENIVADFELSFEVGDSTELKSWLASNEEAWIFLDSVDEAKLKHPRDFELAIKKLSSHIKAAYSRVHIYITSRISEWRPQSDLNMCKLHFPFIGTQVITRMDELQIEELSSQSEFFVEEDFYDVSESDDASFKVWTLKDLSKEQVALFVNTQFPNDSTIFLDEIERQDAWVYTTRPQDLEELIQYWTENNKIGTRYDLIKHNIERRLRERASDREFNTTLTTEKIRQGVKLLAAASVLTHQSSILIPDSSTRPSGIDCETVLTDWTPGERKLLLNRPIFDEAIYGTVRFHHRSVREYLTAEWLADKLKEFSSRVRIENLFFRTQYDIPVIIPSMKPVLSWLALMDEKIRTHVYKLEPEIILTGGDPGQLPLETRKKILHKVCEKIAESTLNGNVNDEAAVKRFANVDLTIDIKLLLKKYESEFDVVCYLLRLIQLSNIVDLEPEVIAIASSKNAPGWTRIAAVKCAKQIAGAERFSLLVDGFLAEDELLDRGMIALIISNLGFGDTDIEWVLSSIAKSRDKKEYAAEGLTYTLSSYIDSCPIDAIQKLIVGFDQLLQSPPHVDKTYCQVSSRFGWLIPLSIQAVEKLVIQHHPFTLTKPCLFVLSMMPACSDFASFDSPKLKQDLRKLIPEWKELNDLLFWESVSIVRQNEQDVAKGRVNHVYQVSWLHFYWNFEGEDFDRILKDVANRDLADDKLVALSLAFHLYVNNNRQNEKLEALKQSAETNDLLRMALEEFLYPKQDTESLKRIKVFQEERKLEEKNNQKRKQDQQLKMDESIKVNVSKIRNNSLGKGHLSRQQAYLLGVVRNDGSNHSRSWTSGNWKLLIPKFGIEVAEAFRDSLINFWRNYKPSLRSESGKDDGSVTYEVIYGLSGIAVESSDIPEWVENLSDEEVDILCRYAFHELNDFPAWLQHVYRVFPWAVKHSILHEIYWELDHPESSSKRLYVLYKVGTYGHWLHDGIAKELLDRIEKQPPSIAYIHYLLDIIKDSNSILDDRLESMARSRVQESDVLEEISLWLTTWIEINPAVAIPTFEETVDTLAKIDYEAAKKLVMLTIVALVGEPRKPNRIKDAFKTATNLRHLNIIIYKYVRPEDDIKHEGVFSPQLRDDAQDARRTIFGMLKEIKGKETYLALVEIAAVQRLQAEKQWMSDLAIERAELDSDSQPWNVYQFLEFENDLESRPTNNQQLFSLIMHRLIDLKFDLEYGDYSVAGLVEKAEDEPELRNYIGNWCREVAKGRYFIAQENELADGKKPDLTFSALSVPGHLPVELKFANNWTADILAERLENQLCGDYLRDVRSEYGIFLLVNREANKKWTLSDVQKKITFPELIEHLQEQWEKMSSKFSDIERVEVIGIDLTQRTTSRSE